MHRLCCGCLRLRANRLALDLIVLHALPDAEALRWRVEHGAALDVYALSSAAPPGSMQEAVDMLAPQDDAMDMGLLGEPGRDRLRAANATRARESNDPFTTEAGMRGPADGAKRSSVIDAAMAVMNAH